MTALENDTTYINDALNASSAMDVSTANAAAAEVMRSHEKHKLEGDTFAVI